MSLPLLALFLAAFAFGTAEFVIAGVLPDVAEGLGVSIPIAGYLVSGYAIGIAIGAILGATLLDGGFGYRNLPLIGTASLILAVFIATLSWWLEQRSGDLQPSPAG